MDSIKEARLLECKKFNQLFEGQSCNIFRPSLANGLQQPQKIGEFHIGIVFTMEGMCYQGFPVIYWLGFSIVACYNVELLP